MFPEPRHVESNGIRLAVYEQGQGPAVVLLHGFPELAFSWRHQLPALAAAGFRAIAPDQRGYGRSDVPPDVADYGIENLIADVHGLLDALDVETATFVGHDWGALVLWQMAIRSPDRMNGLIQLNVPHIPRTPADPIELMRKRFGDDFYIVDFQDSDEADRSFAADPERVFDVMMRRNLMSREQYEQLPPDKRSLSLLRLLARREPGGDALLSDAERDYYVEAFQRTGFTGAINWYRNWTRNWETQEGYDDVIPVPTLFIGAVDDTIIAPAMIEGMKPFVPDLELHMLEDCGHWSQQEKPDEVNALMIDWLRRRVARP